MAVLPSVGVGSCCNRGAPVVGVIGKSTDKPTVPALVYLVVPTPVFDSDDGIFAIDILQSENGLPVCHHACAFGVLTRELLVAASRTAGVAIRLRICVVSPH